MAAKKNSRIVTDSQVATFERDRRDTLAKHMDQLLAGRTNQEIDALRIARARALFAAAPVGSKLAQIYADQVAGIAAGYPVGAI